MKNKPTLLNVTEQQWEWFGQHFITTTHSSTIYIVSTPDTNLGHSSNKRKPTRLNQSGSSRSVSTRQDTRDQVYLPLVNARFKENKASPKKESPKS